MELTVRLEHAWIVLQSYSLTAEQAAESLKEGVSVPLTEEMHLGTAAGPICFHCHQGFLEATGFCPGVPLDE